MKKQHSLPRNAVTPWGFEHLAKTLAPCACGGSPVLIQGGSPTTYRYYCQNAHSAPNNGRPCEVTTKERESLAEAVYEWNCMQEKRGVDLRPLHPLNRASCDSKNPNCDNDKCNSPNGQVRVLPSGGDSNLILCRSCFEYEIRYRKERNRELSKDCQFKLPKWEDLKVYNA